MSGKQTRRSISVRTETYDKLVEECKRRGVSCSSVVEKLIKEYLDKVERLGTIRKLAEKDQ